LIDPNFAMTTLSPIDTERFQKVYAYIIANYTQDIDLQVIASIAHFTPTAFCRYFKKMTRKTLVDVITEFRIKHACQLLRSTEKSVYDICFESGFGNISYFNKSFKKAIGQSPLNYRKLFYQM
jgi:YesN/AraC family two-component response regulator